TKELTLLFSDVRGFTAIAEDFKDDPAALTRLMNEFLTILSNAIMDNGGTIDKFMGDAVMAFWNAPGQNKDHIRLACRTALRMTRDIKAFNSRRAATERLARMKARKREISSADSDLTPTKIHRINVGIGINTGPCVVGNMGSEGRFDYTALGDPVNVASRLEGQSRYYGAQVILGSATARVVADELAVLELDTVRVVGKELPEQIFALVGDSELRQKPEFQSAIEQNREMLQAYRTQDWTKAETQLELVEATYRDLRLKLDDYVALYRQRISDLRATPPAANWDGVFSFTKKSS
ncbi:MAG: adenylate/guanylate cyclase domain-containing protein, partial [Pseudomonadota bacterium]